MNRSEQTFHVLRHPISRQPPVLLSNEEFAPLSQRQLLPAIHVKGSITNLRKERP
jgi:hypothetical protein